MAADFVCWNALQLRCKDLDLTARVVTVFDGKGRKDRRTLIPESLVEPLRLQIQSVDVRHRDATRMGYAGVAMPTALARKYPRAQSELGWQYLFPATTPSRDPRSGAWQRHHLHEASVQRRVNVTVVRQNRQTRHLPHLPPLLRHPSDRIGLRHSRCRNSWAIAAYRRR